MSTVTDHRGFDLAQMALSVHEEATVPETGERVLDFARAAVDCSHAAVVFVHAKRRLEIVASTDPAIAALIAKQVEVHAGPILSMVAGPGSPCGDRPVAGSGL